MRHGKWYAYNPANGQPYGTPLQDFLPSAHIDTQGLGNWATAATARKPLDERVVGDWKKLSRLTEMGPIRKPSSRVIGMAIRKRSAEHAIT